ncbi:hypothetical protein [Dictyobacter kobayashii]|uniref:Uncharacterized protein n=1 Tax=Dictyobacter kobayashii TaxID=2014872 RepID=A0A402AFG7_9CHLR|nr:hypothetical protein [Dictyobacter kobayashii]GCE17814.1 hypothetical protein KDK_16140 [Dictyobacter kobayashii]
MEHKQQKKSDGPQEPNEGTPSTSAEQKEQSRVEVVPGVPIVRSNTPRPLSYEMMVSSGGSIRLAINRTQHLFRLSRPKHHLLLLYLKRLVSASQRRL